MEVYLKGLSLSLVPHKGYPKDLIGLSKRRPPGRHERCSEIVT